MVTNNTNKTITNIIAPELSKQEIKDNISNNQLLELDYLKELTNNNLHK